MDHGIAVVLVSLNLSDSLSMADRLLVIGKEGIQEVLRERFPDTGGGGTVDESGVRMPALLCQTGVIGWELSGAGSLRGAISSGRGPARKRTVLRADRKKVNLSGGSRRKEKGGLQMKTKRHAKHSFCRSISGLLLALLMIVTAAIPVPSQAAAEENGAAAAAVVPGKTRITSARAASATAVFLDWEKAKNATSYYVCYKLSGGKILDKDRMCERDLGYAHISKNLKEGKRYLYTVRAYNAKSKRLGGYSNVVAVVPKNVQPTSVKFNKATMVLSNKADRTPSNKNLLRVTILPKNATTNTCEDNSVKSRNRITSVYRTGNVRACT